MESKAAGGERGVKATKTTHNSKCMVKRDTYV